MQASPLEVEGYFFTRVDVQANIDFEGGEPGCIELDSNLDFRRNTEDRALWQVTLEIGMDVEKNAGAPYHGVIEVVGMFRHEPIEGDDANETKLRTIIGANAPALLYSAAREMYLMIAGRGPWPPARWPAVHFRDTVPLRPEGEGEGRTGESVAE